jgi:Na+-translocating ferredoxin:NAD+ oxidoreductase subunit G
MKEIFKMALTLMLITAVSAASLSFVHSKTSVVIAEREAEKAQEAIKKFFPAVADIEDETYEGVAFQVVYDADSNFLGVLAEAKASGYAGHIPYQLAINSDGEIISILYGTNEETVGIGKKIEEESFISQIIGLTPEDPIELGKDIDAISGATISSTAMARSVRDTMDKFAANFLGR